MAVFFGRAEHCARNRKKRAKPGVWKNDEPTGLETPWARNNVCGRKKWPFGVDAHNGARVQKTVGGPETMARRFLQAE
jgi:hypothetical protein